MKCRVTEEETEREGSRDGEEGEKREVRRESAGDRQPFYPVVHFSSVYNNSNWDRPMPGARNSMWAS